MRYARLDNKNVLFAYIKAISVKGIVEPIHELQNEISGIRVFVSNKVLEEQFTQVWTCQDCMYHLPNSDSCTALKNTIVKMPPLVMREIPITFADLARDCYCYTPKEK